MKILFVCLGNICRSPMAEGAMRDLVARAGLTDRITTDSCGTGAWHSGEPADPRSVATARQHGVDISDLRARRLRPSDLVEFDYIRVADARNLRDVLAVADDRTRHKVALLLDEAPELGLREIPDPYHDAVEGFEHVWHLVATACAAMLKRVAAERA